MNKNSTSGMRDSAEKSAEAARYALTRRLLPVLRHHMVVHLQPIGMIYEVLDRKLVSDPQDMAPVREGLGKINTLARSAIRSCLDVVTWLAPDALALAALGAGVSECLELVASNFRFRGFTVDNQVGDVPFMASQTALREVFTAALMACTDGATGVVRLTVTARLSGDTALVSIDTQSGEGSGFTTEMAYRAIAWDDVRALSEVHHVAFTQAGSLVTLGFSAASPAAPAAS